MHDQIHDAKAPVNRANVAVQLHSMMVHRLFENDHWLVLGNEGEELLRTLTQLGLQVNGRYGVEPTAVSGELGGHELIFVFLGMMNEIEGLEILVRYGLLSDAHVRKILSAPGVEGRWEHILRPIVQRAFLEHYNPAGALS